MAWGEELNIEKPISKKEEIKEEVTKAQATGSIQPVQAQVDDLDFVSENRRKNYIYLLYGNSGSGKTYTSLTFPKPLILIDTENRADIIKDECFKGEDISLFNPIVLPDEISEKGEVLDYTATIDRLTNFLLQLNKKVRNGYPLKTLVLDSCSDLWEIAINWGVYLICDSVTKDGKKKADPNTLKFNNQMDWQIPKKKHKNIFLLMKALTKYGINIVLTARNKDTPDYVIAEKKSKMGALYAETFSDKIRCEKNLPFDSDIIIRQTLSSQNKRLSVIEKCFRKGTEEKIVENLTFEEIEEMLK